MSRRRDAAREARWPVQFAGALLVILGLANMVFGVLSLATDLVRLTGETASVLLLLGLGTAVLGILVWRGSRGALLGALVVFGLLLLLESVTAAAGAAARVVVLAVVVATLAFAWLKGRGNRSP